MENLAKPSFGFFRQPGMKRFLLATDDCGPERGLPRDPSDPRSGARLWGGPGQHLRLRMN
jgi:hypothetical protein